MILLQMLPSTILAWQVQYVSVLLLEPRFAILHASSKVYEQTLTRLNGDQLLQTNVNLRQTIAFRSCETYSGLVTGLYINCADGHQNVNYSQI